MKTKKLFSFLLLVQMSLMGSALAQESVPASDEPVPSIPSSPDLNIIVNPRLIYGNNPNSGNTYGMPRLPSGSRSVFDGVNRANKLGSGTYNLSPEWDWQRNIRTINSNPFNSFQTFDVNSMGNLNCIIRTDNLLNGLEQVQNITDVEQCFAKKQSYRRPAEGAKLTERQLIESDQEVCGCLRAKGERFTSLKEILNTETPNLPSFESSGSFSNFQRHVAIVKDKINKRHEMISLQASMIFNGKVDYAAEMLTDLKPVEAKMSVDTENKMLERLGFSLDLSRGDVSQENRQRRQQRAELAGKIKLEMDQFAEPKEPNLALFQEKKFAPNQCLGFREFVSFQTLPRSKSMAALLKKPFSSRDWDYKRLKGLYSTYMGQSPDRRKRNKEEIQELKEKLFFLDTNPMIKNLISAADNMKDYEVDSSVDKSVRDANRAKFSDEKLKAIESNIFNIMSKFADNKNPKEYRDSLSAFFANDDMKQLNNIMTHVEDKREQAVLTSEESLLPPDMFKPENLTQKTLEEDFQRATGLGSPDDCTSGGVDIPKCAETYAGYCRTVDRAVDILRASDSDDQISNDYATKLEKFLNPEISKNEDFSKANEAVCNTPKKKNRNDPRETGKTFFDFKDEYCASTPGASECLLATPGDYEKIRTKFMAEYKFNADPKDNADMSDETYHELGHTLATAPVKVMSSQEVSQMLNPSSSSGGFGSLVNNNGGSSRTTPAKPFADTAGASFARGLGNLANAMGSSEAAVDEGANYSNNTIIPGAQGQGQVAEVPKVENMNQTEREELLEDWKKEMADWKANKGKDEGSQTGASATESAMKAKIEALEALLAQQKQLTEDQYKLLNDSIAAQTRAGNPVVGGNQDDSGDAVSSSRRNRSNGIVGSNPDVDNDVQRGPASVQDTQLNTSGSGAGNLGGAGASRSRSSGSNAISSDSSRDSVAREEAKLVNLRENSNGSITISSAGAAAGTAIGNAISVNVPDAVYQAAQANPVGLNLAQIQSIIPAEQITNLQSRGDFFIILLQNGTNPPLEVKVKKQNNKLVQVDGAPIVQRRVSLDSLRNTLPVKR